MVIDTVPICCNHGVKNDGTNKVRCGDRSVSGFPLISEESPLHTLTRSVIDYDRGTCLVRHTYYNTGSSINACNRDISPPPRGLDAANIDQSESLFSRVIRDG
jgi:hypothetical protein